MHLHSVRIVQVTRCNMSQRSRFSVAGGVRSPSPVACTKPNVKNLPHLSNLRGFRILPFVWKPVNGPHAFGQGLKHGLPPTAGTAGGCVLVGLFVGLSEEMHGRLLRCDEFLHSDHE